MTKAEIRKFFQDRGQEQPVIRQCFEIRAEDASFDSETGTLKGNANVIGELDSYGTVTFPGFFSEVLGEFLKTGSVLIEHNSDDLPIAFPTLAHETGKHLYTEARFHSTQRAQDARTVAKERLDAGKSVGLSIGFVPDYSTGVEYFSNGKELIKHARSLGMPMDLFNVKQIEAHSGPCRANLPGGCKRLIEYSMVGNPANKPSGATDVRSGSFQETLVEAEPERRFSYWMDEDDDPWEDVEEGICLSAVDTLNYAMRRCLYIALSMDGDAAGKTNFLRGHLSTYSDKFIEVFSSIMSLADDNNQRSAVIAELRKSLEKQVDVPLGEEIAKLAKQSGDPRAFEKHLRETFGFSRRQATVLSSGYFSRNQPDPALQSDSGGEETGTPKPEARTEQSDSVPVESLRERNAKYLELRDFQRRQLRTAPFGG